MQIHFFVQCVKLNCSYFLSGMLNTWNKVSELCQGPAAYALLPANVYTCWRFFHQGEPVKTHQFKVKTNK